MSTSLLNEPSGRAACVYDVGARSEASDHPVSERGTDPRSGRLTRSVGWWCGLGLAGLTGAFALGRASVEWRSGPGVAPAEVRENAVVAARPSLGSAPVVGARAELAPTVDASQEARVDRVRASLRALNLSKHNLLPSVCRMARWLECADEEALEVALVEGESLVGRKAAETLIPLVFLRWGEIDRDGALDAMSVYYRNRPSEKGGSPYDEITPFFSQWAETDPRAALEALFTVDLPEGMARPQRSVLGEIVERDPHLAATLSVELATSDDKSRQRVGRGAFYSAMMSLRKADGLEQALAWANQQPSSDLRNDLVATLTTGLLDSGEDAEALATYAALGSAPISTDPELLGRVAGAMVRVDPVRAQSWVQSLPSGTARESAVTTMTAQITEKQSAAQALAWLQGCGSQADFDSAYQAISESWPADDPSGKYRCVQAIADPVQRSWRKYDAAFAWMRVDEAAATQALPGGMITKIKQAQSLGGAYRDAMQELFPGAQAQASFTITPQGSVAADEPSD